MSSVLTPVTHPVRLTERINRIEPSSTMAAAAEAEKLRQQGIDIVDVTAGEPHFSTPQHVKTLPSPPSITIFQNTRPSAARLN